MVYENIILSSILSITILMFIIGLLILLFWVFQFISLIKTKMKSEIKALWIVFFILVPGLSALIWWIFKANKFNRTISRKRKKR